MSNNKLNVNDLEVVLYKQNEQDFISLTDMARFRDPDRSNYIIQNWMRTKNTIEFLGLWEQLNNPGFKGIEFDAFKNEVGSNAFSMTPVPAKFHMVVSCLFRCFQLRAFSHLLVLGDNTSHGKKR